MESEIFGHVKGAFSGADSHRDGAATTADGGTLFLDEIGEMDIGLQAKLLRFIQTGWFKKVGSDKPEKTDIRFVAATNRDPMKAIEEQTLREDLFYRLNVISINLPDLKDRDTDSVQIAQYFLTRFSDEEQKNFVGFSADALALLSHYHWPGNVRQLRNLIHSAVIMSEGTLLTSSDLGYSLKLDESSVKKLCVSVNTSPTSKVSDSHKTTISVVSELTQKIEPLSQTERKAIERAIQHFNGNVMQAASALEVSPSTLYRKMQS